jgi:hypothetical protein
LSACPLVRLSQRGGAVAPLTVLSLALLVGVAALVIDAGTLMEARRHLQAAADAAALAGADDLYLHYPTNQGYDYGGTALSSALATASANSYTNGPQTSVIVTVPTSPGSKQTYQGGPNAGQPIPPGYIEVIIRYNAPHIFSSVFGAGTSPIYARAVARGLSKPLVNNGLIALNLNGAGALNVTGAGGLNVNGGVLVNSNNSLAIQVGLLCSITAAQFTVNLSLGDSLESILSLLLGPGGSAPTVAMAPAIPDPLRNLPAPPVPIQTYSNTTIAAGATQTLFPGHYIGGINIRGGPLLNPTTVTFQANNDGSPGVYYLDGGGLNISGGTVKITTAASGVMFYNNWSSSTDVININATGAITITPPAYGTYRGISIFQKRGTLSSYQANQVPPITLTAPLGANLNLTGTIYAAYANVALHCDALNNVMGGQIIADTITTSGSVIININPNGPQPIANQRYLGLVQ